MNAKGSRFKPPTNGRITGDVQTQPKKTTDEFVGNQNPKLDGVPGDGAGQATQEELREDFKRRLAEAFAIRDAGERRAQLLKIGFEMIEAGGGKAALGLFTLMIRKAREIKDEDDRGLALLKTITGIAQAVPRGRTGGERRALFELAVQTARESGDVSVQAFLNITSEVAEGAIAPRPAEERSELAGLAAESARNIGLENKREIALFGITQKITGAISVAETYEEKSALAKLASASTENIEGGHARSEQLLAIASELARAAAAAEGNDSADCLSIIKTNLREALSVSRPDMALAEFAKAMANAGCASAKRSVRQQFFILAIKAADAIRTVEDEKQARDNIANEIAAAAKGGEAAPASMLLADDLFSAIVVQCREAERYEWQMFSYMGSGFAAAGLAVMALHSFTHAVRGLREVDEDGRKAEVLAELSEKMVKSVGDKAPPGELKLFFYRALEAAAFIVNEGLRQQTASRIRAQEEKLAG